jgi:hypothetical protein
MKYKIYALGIGTGALIGYYIFKNKSYIEREIYNSIDLNVKIGVVKHKQYIKINNKLYYLKKNYKSNLYISFTFDNNIVLSFIKFDDYIMISAFDDNGNILTKHMDPTLIKNFKKINYNSQEIDYIYDFING